MEINQVRYFLEVCTEKNFTRAARKCGISQPSLTRAVQLLEKEFGGHLFDRQAGKVILTELGRVVLPYLQNVWEQTSAVKKLTSDMAGRNAAVVRLGVMCTISPGILIDAIVNVRNRHPEIQFEVVDGTARTLEQQLLDSDLDIAIYARPKRSPNPRLNYMTLLREQMLIVVPETHAFAGMSEVRVADLAGEHYVMRSLCEFNEPSEDDAGPRSSVSKAAYRSDRDDWVFAMIENGFGYGFVPRHSVGGKNLISRPLVEPEFWREIHLTTVLGRSQSASVGAIIHEFMTSRGKEAT